MHKISSLSLPLNTMLLYSFLAFCATIFFPLCYSFLPEKYKFEGIIILVMIVITLFSLLHYHVRYKNPLGVFSPLHMVLLPYAIYFIIFPLDMIINDRILIDRQELYLPSVMIYVLLGLIAFVSGFFLVLRKGKKGVYASNNLYRNSAEKKQIRLNLGRALFVSTLSAFAAVALFLVMVQMAGGFSYIIQNYAYVYSAFFTKHMYIVSISIGLVLLNLTTHLSIVVYRRRGYSMFIANLIIMSCLLLLQGSRGTLLSVLLVMVVLYHLFIKKLNFPKLFLMFILVMAFMVSLIYFRDVKDTSISLFDIFYGAFIAVNDEMTQVLTLVEGVPDQLSFQYGKSFIQLFLMPIPRFLWESKPYVISVVIKDIFFPHHWELGLSWPPSIIGELYVNFHVFGIVGGMSLFGYLGGKLQVKMLRGENFYLATIYGATLFLIFRIVRGDFATVTSIYLMQMVLFMVCGKFIFPNSKGLKHET